MIQQLIRPAQLQLASEVRVLLYDLTVAAKVLTWDQHLWGSGLGFSSSEINGVAIVEDIVWYRLVDGGALPLSIDQFICYYNQIKQLEAETAESETATLETLNGVPVDVIEMEINGVTETRLGWIETDWDGTLIPHVFLQDGDDQVRWNNHYLKSKAIASPKPTPEEDEEINYIRSLELAMQA